MTRLFRLLMIGIGVKYNYSFYPKYTYKFKHMAIYMKKKESSNFNTKNIKPRKIFKIFKRPKYKNFSFNWAGGNRQNIFSMPRSNYTIKI